MTLTEINVALARIYSDLNKIDLTKETDSKVISKMADKPIADMDKVMQDEGFKEMHLGATVDMLKNATEKIANYDPKEELNEAINNKGKRKEILSRVDAKNDVKQKIQGKYDELSRKQEVIAKYKEKFNPEHLMAREKRKYDINKDKMIANDIRIKEMMNFSQMINGELGTIDDNLTLIKELEDLEKEQKKVNDAKDDFNKEKANPKANPDFISQYEAQIKEMEAKFSDRVTSVSEKYETITLNPDDLKTSIVDAKVTAKRNINTAKSEVGTKLSDAENKYGYSQGFEELVNGKIKSAKDDKEYIKVFRDTIKELESENINLDTENDKITDNVQTMREGQQILNNRDSGEVTTGPEPTGSEPTGSEPTEEEIQNLMKSDPEIKALVPVLTKKETRKKVYDSLTKDKKGKFHPILYLKSFGKKAQSEWKEATYETKMREKAIEKIKEAKAEEIKERKEAAKKEAKSVDAVESKRQKFLDTLFTHVMEADSKSVDQMNKDAEKNPGKVLSEIYDDMQKEEDEEQR